MKRTMTIIQLIFLVSGLNAQVYNTAETLNKGKFSAIGAPVFYDSGIMLLGKLGYGLDYGNDIALTMGFGNKSYLGTDMEKVLNWGNFDNLYMSFSSGVHYCDGFGIDGTINFTVLFDNSLELYSGLDLDWMLTENTGLPTWIFIGCEYNLKNQLAFFCEIDLGINDSDNMIGAGICYYFNSVQIK